MNKSKLKATIFVVALLLAAAAITAVVTGSLKNNKPSPDPDPSATISQTPESATPEETPDPTQTPAPEETPEPQESQAPSADRTVTGSGSFSSNTGTPLNLVVNYSAAAAAGDEVKVTFEVYLSCYSINASAKPGGITLSLDGSSYTDSSPELDVHSDTVTSVKLATKTVTITLPAGQTASLPATVSWAFGGSYSDVELKTIDATGTVSISG